MNILQLKRASFCRVALGTAKFYSSCYNFLFTNCCF